MWIKTRFYPLTREKELQAEAALSEVEAPETDRNRRLLWAVISPLKSGFCSETSEKLP